MSLAADRIREKAREYELEALHAGEKVSAGASVPPDLFFAVQKVALDAVSCALYEVANVLEEEIAA